MGGSSVGSRALASRKSIEAEFLSEQFGGAIAGAVNRLLDAGEVTEAGGTYRIVDYLLAELIRRGWTV